MKATRMRKTDVQQLSDEGVVEERGAMDEFDGAFITVKKELNSYEENLTRKHQRPFVVKTTEILIIE